MPADCSEKVVSTREDKTLYQRVPTPRPHPKIVMMDAWQVQHNKEECSEDQAQENRVRKGKSIKIDFRVQGVPQKKVLEDQGRMTKIQNLAYTLRNQSRTESMITDFEEDK